MQATNLLKMDEPKKNPQDFPDERGQAIVYTLLKFDF